MCQSEATPSSALYWHMGETTIRFASSRSASRMGENKALVIVAHRVGGIREKDRESIRKGEPPAQAARPIMRRSEIRLQRAVVVWDCPRGPPVSRIPPLNFRQSHSSASRWQRLPAFGLGNLPRCSVFSNLRFRKAPRRPRAAARLIGATAARLGRASQKSPNRACSIQPGPPRIGKSMLTPTNDLGNAAMACGMGYARNPCSSVLLLSQQADCGWAVSRLAVRELRTVCRRRSLSRHR
jgi:hypothetical protein